MNTAIFDMDGLLINSEPLWQIAEKKVFRTVGINLTDEMCLKTMGRRTDEVVSFWFRQYPWEGKALKEIELEIVKSVTELIEAHGSALDGVHDTLEVLKNNQFQIGLASSSSIDLIHSVLAKLRIGEYFQVIHSAMDEKQGKPHPAVYLTAAEKLNVEPTDCFVFEDSLAGVRAAKGAGMMVIAIPSPDQYISHEFELADLKLRSLSDFSIQLVM